MNLKTTFLAASLVVGCMSTYYIGYHNGAKDVATDLQPRLTELQAKKKQNNKLMKEVEDINHKVDILNARLATPVVLANSNLTFQADTKVARFKISAYSPYDDKNYINSDGDPSNTATGTTPKPGTFAVDPNVIPYGSKITIMYPDGTVEHGVAEDTGGAIKNNRIDVFRYTYTSAIEFGMKDAIVIWQ